MERAKSRGVTSSASARQDRHIRLREQRRVQDDWIRDTRLRRDEAELRGFGLTRAQVDAGDAAREAGLDDIAGTHRLAFVDHAAEEVALGRGDRDERADVADSRAPHAAAGDRAREGELGIRGRVARELDVDHHLGKAVGPAGFDACRDRHAEVDVHLSARRVVEAERALLLASDVPGVQVRGVLQPRGPAAPPASNSPSSASR